MSTAPITDEDIAILRRNYDPNVIGARTVNRLLDEIERLRDANPDALQRARRTWASETRRADLLEAHLKQVRTEMERLNTEFVKRLTLPPWDDVEVELVSIYSNEISTYDGVKAVYGRVQDMLAHELVAARAAMAGDDQ